MRWTRVKPLSMFSSRTTTTITTTTNDIHIHAHTMACMVSFDLAIPNISHPSSIVDVILQIEQ